MRVEAMCANQSCPSFTRCWKAQATPKKVQLYDNKLKVLEGNTRCHAYMEIRLDENGSGSTEASE